MRIAIIGSKGYDSMEYNLWDACLHIGHEAAIFDLHDYLFTKNKYGIKADELMRKYSDYYDQKIFRKIAQKVIDWQPELVICVYRFIHPTLISTIKTETKSRIIHINPDAITTFEYQQVFMSDYDAWFTKDPYIVNFMRKNMKLNAILYYEAFNQRIHKKTNKPKQDAESEANIDVMTYGTIYPYRSKMLKHILDANIKLSIYGIRPNRFYDHSLDRAFKNKYIMGCEKAALLYGAKIVFNQMHYAEIESVNCRFFEANGCGAFQLVDYRPILHKLLPINPELVSFKGIDEGIDKIKYYLKHPQERYELSEKIHRYTIERFSYDHLIQYILKSIS